MPCLLNFTLNNHNDFRMYQLGVFESGNSDIVFKLELRNCSNNSINEYRKCYAETKLLFKS